MRINEYALTLLAIARTTSPADSHTAGAGSDRLRRRYRFVHSGAAEITPPAVIDYDVLATRVLAKMRERQQGPTVIDGDLIVEGRLGLRGSPEPGTDGRLVFLSVECRLAHQKTHRSLGAEPRPEASGLGRQHSYRLT